MSFLLAYFQSRKKSGPVPVPTLHSSPQGTQDPWQKYSIRSTGNMIEQRHGSFLLDLSPFPWAYVAIPGGKPRSNLELIAHQLSSSTPKTSLYFTFSVPWLYMVKVKKIFTRPDALQLRFLCCERAVDHGTTLRPPINDVGVARL